MMKFTKSLLFCALMGALQAQAEEFPWHVNLDGLSAEIDAVVDENAGAYFVSVADLENAGVDLKGLPVENGRINLAALGAIERDELKGVLTVRVKAELRPPVSISMAGVPLYKRPDSSVNGFYINHDTRLDSNGGITNVSSLWDTNASVNGWRGNLQTIVRSGVVQKRAEKLNASVSRDDLDNSTVLTLGDSWSVGGENVSPAYFTGVQYKTDYAGLNPGFFMQPTMRLAGTANAPSTMDIVVNNQVVAQKNIPAGPFSVSNILPTMGQNNAQVIIRDAFGQQQVLTAELVGSPRLLKTGLLDYGVQGGQLKGGDNSMFLAGYTRKGINDWLTGEASFEAGKSNRVGANVAVGTGLGSFSASARAGNGSKLDLTYQNAFVGDGWRASVNASVTRVSTGYLLMGGGVQRDLATVSAALQASGWSYSAVRTNTNGMRMTNLSANRSPSKPNDMSWSFVLSSSSFAASKSSSFFVNAMIPFDTPSVRHSVNAGVSQSNGESIFRLADDISPKTNRGASYRIAGEKAPKYNRADASMNYAHDLFDASAAVSTTGQQTGYRANLRGALVVADGFIAASRTIQGGAILVDAKATDMEGTEVILNGSHSGKLNAQGRAVATGFSPFIKTRVEILPDSFAFNEIAATTATARNGISRVEFKPVSAAMIAIPEFTSGVLVVDGKRFPITDRGAFVEMPVGRYTGYVNGKTPIEFEIKG